MKNQTIDDPRTRKSMPRKEHVITVFLASPGDVQAERDKVEEVVAALNLIWGRSLGIRLELVRWETHAYPSIGLDAQDVINGQINDDYDIFLGIMWCRYGTPTGRAGSGTVEEFDRALARYKVDPASVDLMFYFKSADELPPNADPNQVASVQKFQKVLQSEGVLYWPFNELNQFERLLHIHLARQVQKSDAYRTLIAGRHSAALQPVSAARPETPQCEPEAGDTEEMADNHDVFMSRSLEAESHSNVITACLVAFKQESEDIAAAINALAAEINNDRNKVAWALNELEPLLTRWETALNQMSLDLSRELPPYSAAANAAMDAVIRSTIDRIGLGRTGRLMEMHQGALARLVKWQGLTEQLHEIARGLVESLRTLPDRSEKLTSAKRKAVLSAGKLLAQRANELVILREGEILIREALAVE